MLWKRGDKAAAPGQLLWLACQAGWARKSLNSPKASDPPPASIQTQSQHNTTTHPRPSLPPPPLVRLLPTPVCDQWSLSRLHPLTLPLSAHFHTTSRRALVHFSMIDEVSNYGSIVSRRQRDEVASPGRQRSRPYRHQRSSRAANSPPLPQVSKSTGVFPCSPGHLLLVPPPSPFWSVWAPKRLPHNTQNPISRTPNSTYPADYPASHSSPTPLPAHLVLLLLWHGHFWSCRS